MVTVLLTALIVRLKEVFSTINIESLNRFLNFSVPRCCASKSEWEMQDTALATFNKT